MLIAARSSKDFACCLRATASAPRAAWKRADLARGADFSIERGKAHD